MKINYWISQSWVKPLVELSFASQAVLASFFVPVMVLDVVPLNGADTVHLQVQSLEQEARVSNAIPAIKNTFFINK
jgi:hypothetical protein